MKLYGISNCNTVKKARDWLDEHGVTYQFHDFKKLGINDTTLEIWLNQINYENLINRAGLTWRGLSDDVKTSITSNTSAIYLMKDKTSVIKRPILEKNGFIMAVGFSEMQYQLLLKA